MRVRFAGALKCPSLECPIRLLHIPTPHGIRTAAEQPPAVGDPHLRDVPVVFQSNLDAEIPEQRPPPEDCSLAVDHGDHPEPRS
jgi:hypothetical protein